MSLRVALIVAYDGTDLQGWQSQSRRMDSPPGSQRTVQEILEGALSRICSGESVIVEGAGRTDAGAHAIGAVAHADVERVPGRPRRRLNGVLPADVRVRGVALMPPSFHARKSATGKRYAYRFWCDDIACPLQRRFTWHVGSRLDMAAMRAAARGFVGEHDFASLQSTGSSVSTTRRHVTRCELVGEPPDMRLEVEGTGFLRHMVRTMAGSLVEVGLGRQEPAWISRMLAERSRHAAGKNAPARGLVLEHVRFDEPHASLLARALAGEDPARSNDCDPPWGNEGDDDT